MLCYAMLCYAMLCYAMPRYVFFGGNRFERAAQKRAASLLLPTAFARLSSPPLASRARLLPLEPASSAQRAVLSTSPRPQAFAFGAEIVAEFELAEVGVTTLAAAPTTPTQTRGRSRPWT